MLFRRFAYFVWALLLLVFAGCGGGSGGAALPGVTEPIQGATVLRDEVKILSSTENWAVIAESKGVLLVPVSVGPRLGDIIVTSGAALKVKSVDGAANGLVKIQGESPAVEEVFKSINIAANNVQLGADQFVPANSSVRVTEARSFSAGGNSPKQQLTFDVDKELGDFTAKISIQMSPTLSYAVNTEGGPRGSISFKAPVTISPSLKVSTELMDLPATEFLVGKFVVPVSPVGAAGLISVEVPIAVVLSAKAGKVTASVGATGNVEYGVELKIQPTSINLVNTSTPFSWGQVASNDNSMNFDIGASTSVSARLKTGVNLTALFGAAKPISVNAFGGLKASLLYAKLASPKAGTPSPFDFSCLSGRIDGTFDIEASAKLYGLSATITPISSEIGIKQYSPVAGCTEVELAADPKSFSSNEKVQVKFEATLPSVGLFDSKPKGSVSFVLTGGDAGNVDMCVNIPVTSDGKANCTFSVGPNEDGKPVVVEARYSGDAIFGSGTGTVAVEKSKQEWTYQYNDEAPTPMPTHAVIFNVTTAEARVPSGDSICQRTPFGSRDCEPSGPHSAIVKVQTDQGIQSIEITYKLDSYRGCGNCPVGSEIVVVFSFSNKWIAGPLKILDGVFSYRWVYRRLK